MAVSHERRTVLGGIVTYGLLVAGGSSPASLIATPPEGPGPFYPQDIPLDHDADLVQVAGRAGKAAGDIVQLFGRVLTPAGKPLAGVTIEIWQVDAKGIYHHPGDWRGAADPNFQGYGTALAMADGSYRFRTIKPMPYPGRTPHIHAMVSGIGIRRFTTQIYLKDHPRNADDFLFKGLGDARLQDASSVDFRPQGDGEAAGRFDIVIG